MGWILLGFPFLVCFKLGNHVPFHADQLTIILPMTILVRPKMWDTQELSKAVVVLATTIVNQWILPSGKLA